MEAEKVHQEKVPRTVQQIRDGGGLAQFVDNRPSPFAREMTEQPVQRIGLDAEEDEEGLQMKVNATIQQKPNNTGLPDNLKAGVENLSGFSLDDVKVHYNSSQPESVQALAYTQGTDIHVAPGQEQHLPHEAWHVAQQMAGRVDPTTEIGGLPVNDSVALEQEADVMGTRANSL